MGKQVHSGAGVMSGPHQKTQCEQHHPFEDTMSKS